MKITTTTAALALCLAAAAGCQQTEVRGPAGESVTTTLPRSLTVHRGTTVPLEVGIDRERFSGPVTVTISQLPKGVRADHTSATVETTSARFMLEAEPTADLVANQQVEVVVEAMGGRRSMQYVALDVLD